MTMKSLIHAAGLALCAMAPLMAQGSGAHFRVVLPTGPTNMWVNWNQVSIAPAVQSDSFLAIMPLSAVPTWAFWEPDETMNLTYGAGNWSQVVMTANEWAYLSADPCAHLPAAGNVEPLSMLTSDYDSGPYSGVPGVPLFPGMSYHLPVAWPPNSPHVVGGLMNMSTFNLERWQLRTRGFFPSDAWNACAPNGTITPNFSGLLAARFTFSVQ